MSVALNVALILRHVNNNKKDIYQNWRENTAVSHESFKKTFQTGEIQGKFQMQQTHENKLTVWKHSWKDYYNLLVYLEVELACQEEEHETEVPLLVEKQVLLLLAEVPNEGQPEVTSGGAAGERFAQVWL